MVSIVSDKDDLSGSCYVGNEKQFQLNSHGPVYNENKVHFYAVQIRCLQYCRKPHICCRLPNFSGQFFDGIGVGATPPPPPAASLARICWSNSATPSLSTMCVMRRGTIEYSVEKENASSTL